LERVGPEHPVVLDLGPKVFILGERSETDRLRALVALLHICLGRGVEAVLVGAFYGCRRLAEYLVYV
jgi:hypothetical protein